MKLRYPCPGCLKVIWYTAMRGVDFVLYNIKCEKCGECFSITVERQNFAAKKAWKTTVDDP